MRRGVLGLFMLALVVLAVAGCRSRPPAASDPTAQDVPQAEKFVDLLAKGDYQVATQGFDDTMRAALPAAKLRDAWNGVVAQAGDYQKRTGTRTAREQGFTAVYVTCQFARSPLAVKVVFDASHQISGLWFVPATA